MASIQLNLKSSNDSKLLIELDANKFERLLADFGYFNDDFLKSVDQAEKEVKSGKTKKLRSLKSVR